MLGIGSQQGFGGAILQFAVLPAAFGVMLVVFVFDYVPHHPHSAMRKENLYGCTSVVGGLFSPGGGSISQMLTFLLCGQNYHAIHHLYPCVPFYAYSKIWKR